MFPTSSQKKFWVFSSGEEIHRLQSEANEKFINEYGKDIKEEDRASNFLTVQEEQTLLRFYEYILKDFCARFQPPMPKYVVGCALTYLKRIYIHNSIMDFHPRDMMLTCVYLASKVEEFNVSIMQFVANMKGDRERFADVILSFELQLMHLLNYHLTVHSPYRPLEGFLIDLKTRYKDIQDVDKLRKSADDFIDRSLNTNAGLLFSPSQIAIAAILESGSKEGINLDSYITQTLLGANNKDHLPRMIGQIRKMRTMVRGIPPLDKNNCREIEKKLEKCRNPENNPNSDVYKRRCEEKWEDEELRQEKKRARISVKDEPGDSESPW